MVKSSIDKPLSTEVSQVYCEISRSLKLNDTHQGMLRKRGFKARQVFGNGYASMPSFLDARRDSLCAELETKFSLATVLATPGFHHKDGKILIRGSQGLVIPCRDFDGNIIAIKIRSDVIGFSKYHYLSSGSDGGHGSGAHVHVPLEKPEVIETMRITEGELKADLTTSLTGILTISVPGVSNWPKSLNVISRVQPKEVLIAFDSDSESNESVGRALIELYEALHSVDCVVGIETWDANAAKGIDDAITLGLRIDVLKDTAADTFIQNLKKMTRKNMQQMDEEKNDKSVSPNEVAHGFLRLLSCDLNVNVLRYWCENFLIWRAGHYQEIPKYELKAQIMSYICSQPEWIKHANSSFVNNVIANLEGLTLIKSSVHPPVFLNDVQDLTAQYISLKNGILELSSKEHNDQQVRLLPSTPEFFCLNSLPFSYDPAAECPKWINFLTAMQPEEVNRAFLQEWSGLCLTTDATQELMVINRGEGANGKSVFATVLTEVIGPDNVSSVPLEAFSSTHTNLLSQTHGKLANFVDEMNQIEKVPEGLLKNFISGGMITVDRKYKAPLKFPVYAKMMMNTNVMPRFFDRSEGLWRRIAIVDWPVQILDPSKQDKKLKDPEFWKASGELPGIFVWAINGLVRLRTRKHFLIPAGCRAAVREYQLESNPAKVFLHDHLIADKSGSISATRLRLEYEKYSREHGHAKPLGASAFKTEVLRVFPTALHAKHPSPVRDLPKDDWNIDSNPSRSRHWTGIRLKRHDET